MTIDNEKLQSELGITLDSIDSSKLTSILVNSFLYHNDLANNTINAINSKSENSQHNSDILWESFETNNALAFTLRSLILESTTKEI